MSRLRFALLALLVVALGAAGAGLYHAARLAVEDHQIVRRLDGLVGQLVQIEMQRQRAAQPRGSDAPAPQ